NISRSPSIGMDGDFNFVNNVVYNWWNRSADGGDHRSFFNFINNYFKPGPITPKDEPIGHRILKPESGRDKASAKTFGKAYVNGNIMEGSETVTNDNWAGGVQVENKPDAGEYTSQIKSDKPFPMPKVTTITAKEAYVYVLENAGATLPKRDAVDARIVKQVKENKIYYTEGGKTNIGSQYIKRRLPVDSYKMGIITHPSQVGGYPEYKGTSYKDKDNDGMPDSWETAHKLNPNDATDAVKDRDGDGYTNIEEYINSVVKTKV
ncbi:MAG TPA: hypothetical protein VM187_19330, partial [Niastella sp.]|nr:hypothetical protein [Niastella sp.]